MYTAKLREYVRARPNATDAQLRDYLAFHCAVPINDAPAVVQAFRTMINDGVAAKQMAREAARAVAATVEAQRKGRAK